jgi:hypothetical protein
MLARSNPARSLVLLFVLCLYSLLANASPQTFHLPSASGYRIAGTVVSKADARPLAHARVTISDPKDRQKFEFVVTGEDGKFEFVNLPAGKYSLNGSKRGYMPAGYDQHDQYATAIVTGAGLDTETLVLRLPPNAAIAGKVLDEHGDPVRRANVVLYYDDHTSGTDQIRQVRGAQTDDLGEYEMTPLPPGTYFLSVTAIPWYAIHPTSSSEQSSSNPSDSASTIDRSLDVAYATTYYPDVFAADEAMPIPIRGGERIEADLHLTPVPSLHLLFRMPDDGRHGYNIPQIEQPSFDGSTFVQTGSVNQISPGLVEVTGVPAGRYNLRINQSGASLQMDGVDFTKDGDEVDVSKSEPSSTVKFSAKMPAESRLPSHLSVGLRTGTRMIVAAQEFDSKGEAKLEQVAGGHYEVVVYAPDKPYAIAQISADAAVISGHTVTVGAGSSLSVALQVVTGSAEVEGVAKKSSKPFAGAMLVLVPKNSEVDHDLFRRDQSDLDGTFILHNVIPGSYTLLAIENGWDLDWSHPQVISVYLKRGRRIEVGGDSARSMSVPDPIEVQSK